MMSRNDDNDFHPSWLDAENDESHRSDVMPLFGSGSILLQDNSSHLRGMGGGGGGTTISSGDDHSQSSIPWASDIPQLNYGATALKGFQNDPSPPSEKPSVRIGGKRGSLSRKSLTGNNNNNHTYYQTDENQSMDDFYNYDCDYDRPPAPIPTIGWAHRVFMMIEGIAILISLCLLTTQIIPLVYLSWIDIGYLSLVIKIYVSIFCIVLMLIEWDVPIAFLRQARFLQSFITRGFLYSFIGFISMQEVNSDKMSDMLQHANDSYRSRVEWAELFMQITSILMCSLGGTYTLLGMFCLKQVRDDLRNTLEQEWADYYSENL